MTTSSQFSLSIPFTVHELIDRASLLFPTKNFVISEWGAYSYSKVTSLGKKLANKLHIEGIQAGDRILIACGISPYLPIYLYAASMLGAICVPVSNQLKGNRLSFVYKDCLPRHIATVDERFRDNCATIGKNNIVLLDCFEKFLAEIDSIPEYHISHNVIDLDPILLMYTSGSTGMPKAISLSHSNVLSSSESIARYLEISESDRILNFIPFSFDYGLYQLFLTAIRGATLYLRNSFIYKEDIFTEVENEKITGIPFSPSHFVSMFARRHRKELYYPFVRFITSTGSRFPKKYYDDIKHMFPNAKIFSMYGLTECKRVSYLDPIKLKDKPQSVGKPMPNVRVCLLDDSLRNIGKNGTGQLAIEGRNVMQCYWKNPKETKRVLRHIRNINNTVLLTGDYFHIDSEGYLYFLSRKDDIVKIRDVRISTKDVESIILSHPLTAEASVVALQNDQAEPCLLAFVTLIDGKEIQTEKLQQYIAQHVESPYMMPRQILIYDQLPKNENGKINYSALKEIAASLKEDF